MQLYIVGLYDYYSRIKLKEIQSFKMFNTLKQHLYMIWKQHDFYLVGVCSLCGNKHVPMYVSTWDKANVMHHDLDHLFVVHLNWSCLIIVD